MEVFEQYNIVIIGCLFMAVVAAMVFLTWRDKQWIRANFKKDQIIALGFGITCFGLASESGRVKKHRGFLLVHTKGLLFKTRFSNIRYDIPGKSITRVTHGDALKGSRLPGSAVMVHFLDKNRADNIIAFKITYPPQWIKIIAKAFITKDSTRKDDTLDADAGKGHRSEGRNT